MLKKLLSEADGVDRNGDEIAEAPLLIVLLLRVEPRAEDQD
jgi:hypothetical protein